VKSADSGKNKRHHGNGTAAVAHVQTGMPCELGSVSLLDTAEAAINRWARNKRRGGKKKQIA
jgi:hypothetical protein